jgi:hypothetical protein
MRGKSAGFEGNLLVFHVEQTVLVCRGSAAPRIGELTLTRPDFCAYADIGS